MESEILIEGGYADFYQRGSEFALSIGVDLDAADAAFSAAHSALADIVAKEGPFGARYDQAARDVRAKYEARVSMACYMDAVRHMAALLSGEGKEPGSEPRLKAPSFKESDTRLWAILVRFVEMLAETPAYNSIEFIQKAAYGLHLTGAPLGCDFVMYKHSAYSFKLQEELTSLRARGYLATKADGNGVVWSATHISDVVTRGFPKMLGRLRSRMQFVAAQYANAPRVSYLGRMSTALYVMERRHKEGGEALTMSEIAARVRELLPYLRNEPGAATDAAREARAFMTKARIMGFAAGYGV